MIKKIFPLLIVSTVLLFTNCNNSDDTTEITIGEQNALDDEADILFLREYYFQPGTGKITKFVNDDDSSTTDDAFDDDYTPLYDIATKLSSGVWYAKNPEVTNLPISPVTNIDTQKLLLSFSMSYYTPYRNDDNTADYGTLSSYPNVSTTIIGNTLSLGIAQWNNTFYQRTLTDTDETKGYTESYYEMEGFQEAIKLFNGTGRGLADTPIFNGVIVIPSRQNFARDNNAYGFYNNTVVINFELLNKN